MTGRQKRVAAIHDLSGFGRCSLTVALPVLSACGVETACLPTALLSTHTGGLGGFSFLDLTDQMDRFMEHWASLGLSFDGIYSGYLGSAGQVERVEAFIARFGRPETLVLVDPAMADFGRMYTSFTPDFAGHMARLCRGADLIVPNMTEAAFMLGQSYREGPLSREYVEGLLRGLRGLGPRQAVLTGVWLGGESLGAACIDSAGQIDYVLAERVEGDYHGTGDLFASVVMGALMRGRPLPRALRLAVDTTRAAIARTHAAQTDPRFGVNFEAGLGALGRELEG